MTVRAWFSISAALLIVLGISVAYRFFSPLRPPEVVVTTSEGKLNGSPVDGCWPQRGGDLRCEKGPVPDSNHQRIPSSDELLLVVVFPSIPVDGTVTFTDQNGKTVFESKGWERTLGYSVPKGKYTLGVRAEFNEGAYLEWAYAVQAG